MVEPVPEMVPPVADQVTLVSTAPLTVAVKLWVVPPGIVCCVGSMVMVTLCFVGGAVNVRVAEPDAPDGSPDVATMVAPEPVAGAM